MTGYELPVHVVRNYIASGIKLVVHLARLKGGTRRVTGISEITGLRDGDLRLEEIFGFEQTGLDSEGRADRRVLLHRLSTECLKRLLALRCRDSKTWFRPATDLLSGQPTPRLPTPTLNPHLLDCKAESS